jgi:CheY-like chemotaxis protein
MLKSTTSFERRVGSLRGHGIASALIGKATEFIMGSENSEPAIRVSNWTLATGTQSGCRSVASADFLPTKDALRKVVVATKHPFRESLEFLLDLEGYSVVFVESMRDAYSQIKRVQPTLVILCVEMDDSDGFQVLSMLKLDDDTSRIPIVMFARVQEATRRAGTNTEPNTKAVRIIADVFRC